MAWTLAAEIPVIALADALALCLSGTACSPSSTGVAARSRGPGASASGPADISRAWIEAEGSDLLAAAEPDARRILSPPTDAWIGHHERLWRICGSTGGHP
jgi:hypothetical protein